jgi:hypothetical protein
MRTLTSVASVTLAACFVACGGANSNTDPPKSSEGGAEIVKMSEKELWAKSVALRRVTEPKYEPPIFDDPRQCKEVGPGRFTFRMLQSVGDDGYLIEYDGETLYLACPEGGLKDVVDGRKYVLGGLFAPAGTYQYKTVLDAKRTVQAVRYLGDLPKIPETPKVGQNTPATKPEEKKPEKPADVPNCTVAAGAVLANSKLALGQLGNKDLRAKWVKDGSARELAADTDAVLVETKDGFATVRLDGKTWVTDAKSVRAKK